MASEHPAVAFAHETTAGMVSICVFESLHYFAMAPLAAVLGVAVTIVITYHAKRIARKAAHV